MLLFLQFTAVTARRGLIRVHGKQGTVYDSFIRIKITKGQ